MFFVKFCVQPNTFLWCLYITVLNSVFCLVVVCVFVGDTPIGYIMPPVLTLSFVIKIIKLIN